MARPFSYKLHIHADGQTREKIADIQETFNYLLGLYVTSRKVYYDLPAPRPGTHCAYAILCDDDSIYIGHTEGLMRRYNEHIQGHAAQHTKRHKPIKLIHYEEFGSREESVKREKELKTGFGRKWLKREYEAGRTRQAGDGRRYLVYRGRTDHRQIAVIWRDTEGWKKADLDRDKKFVTKQKLTEGADEVFVNGDSFIPNAKALEPVFKARMFAPVEA